jgi:hypothetical protein
MTTLINHWIGGRTVDTEFERIGAVYDPATGQQAMAGPGVSGHQRDDVTGVGQPVNATCWHQAASGSPGRDPHFRPHIQ